MTDIFPPTLQRAALLELAAALRSRDVALRRDECGDWAIFGKFGHIYAIPGGSFDKPDPRKIAFQIVYSSFNGSPRAWGSAKQALSFAKLAQDGDCDGTLVLDRLTTKVEAAAIRDKLGILRRKKVSPDIVLRLRRTPQEAQLTPQEPLSRAGGYMGSQTARMAEKSPSSPRVGRLDV